MGITLRPSEVRSRLHVPLDEPDDAPSPGTPGDDHVQAAFFIEYEAASGEISHREVVVHRCEWAGGGLQVIAFCLMRNRSRSFRADRILSLISARTGEVIDEPEAFFLALARSPARTPSPSRREKVGTPPRARQKPQGAAPQPARLSRDERDALRDLVRPAAIALMYMARADRDVSQGEVEVISELMRDGCRHLGLSAEADENLRQELTSLLPSGNLLYRALKAVRGPNGFPQDLPRRLTQMARADGSAAPEEEQAFREVIATLKRAAEA